MSCQHNLVIAQLAEWHVRSVLNIGLRVTSNLDVYHWCVVNRALFCTIEIHVPNCDFIKKEYIGFFMQGDVHEISKAIPRVDAVTWMHGPEHLTIQHLGETLGALESCVEKGIIIQMPERPETTPFLQGNPWERHLSHPPREYWATRGYTYIADAATVENTATYVKCK